MTRRSTTVEPGSRATGRWGELEQAFRAIRREHEVVEAFPPEVLAAAAGATADPVSERRDETSVPFLTVDPPGSMDLDQALHLERSGAGYRLRYAIADVAAFVPPGGAVDDEARRRGQTIYCPDTRVPLHPPVLSEGAASLLPDVDRPAYVWELVLDADGGVVSTELYRATVRSRRRATYAEVQSAVDGGTAEAPLLLLREVGRLRAALESARGGASLPMPEQEVDVDADGTYRLRMRPLLEVEDWNAQLSLLTGMAAASLMLEGGIGILRTMPPPERRDVDRFRRQVAALGVPWSPQLAYGDFLRTLDRQDPRHLAAIHDATSLFRGAGYAAFDGERPAQAEQAAIAAPYAHVTAPLRRLVDRFGLVVCEALAQGREVPAWVREALPDLPAAMGRSDARARAVGRACLDAVEAAVLAHRVGERFPAVVVDEDGDGRPVIQVVDPAITAVADGRADPGTPVLVELVRADVTARAVGFRLLGPA